MILREHQVMHLSKIKRCLERIEEEEGWSLKGAKDDAIIIIIVIMMIMRHHLVSSFLFGSLYSCTSSSMHLLLAILVLLFIHYFYSLLSSWSWGENPFISQSRREFSLDPLLDMIIIIKSMKQGNEDVAQFLLSFFLDALFLLTLFSDTTDSWDTQAQFSCVTFSLTWNHFRMKAWMTLKRVKEKNSLFLSGPLLD